MNVEIKVTKVSFFVWFPIISTFVRKTFEILTTKKNILKLYIHVKNIIYDNNLFHEVWVNKSSIP